MTAPREVFEQLLAGIARGPTHDLADLYSDDAIVELPYAKPGGLRLEGREAIRAHFARAAQGSAMRLTPERVTIHETTDPEVVIAEYDYRGEVKATGRVFVVANVQIVRVRDGRIIQSRDFHDHAAMAAAMRG